MKQETRLLQCQPATLASTALVSRCR